MAYEPKQPEHVTGVTQPAGYGRVLTGHTKGDEVMVDWNDGRDPSNAVVASTAKGGALGLRFPGEAKTRWFTIYSGPRGYYQSAKGQIVTVFR